MDAGAIGVSSQRMGMGSTQRDYDGTPMATDLMHDETMLVLADVLKKRNEGVIQYTYVDVAARAESEADGPILSSFESVLLDPTAYSPLS